jgi:quinohemoprotein ethanol dehydrogenase
MLKKTGLCLSALLLGSALYGQSPASSSGGAAGAPPTNAWLKAGGNLYSQNFSPLTQINRQNVANLKAVWRARLDGSGIGAKYSGEAQHVFYQGVVYIVTGADDVFATSVATGEVLWKYHADLDSSISTVCCGWTSRGLALGEGKVFVGQLDGRLVALDQKMESGL